MLLGMDGRMHDVRIFRFTYFYQSKLYSASSVELFQVPEECISQRIVASGEDLEELREECKAELRKTCQHLIPKYWDVELYDENENEKEEED